MVSVPDTVNKIRLSDSQINLLRTIQKQDFGMTTAELSNLENITTQNASIMLKKLWNKGYLTRLVMKDKTGGNFYEYWLIESLKTIDILER